MCRILLVGKEPRLIDVLRLGMEAEGHHIMTALDGFEALEMVSGRHPDVIVTDSKMLDELALNKLKRHAPPCRGFAVILLSDGPQPTERHASICNAYIQKPVAVEQLLTLVSQLSPEGQHPASMPRH